MDQATLWREYAALPVEARREVDQLIEALAKRHAAAQVASTGDKQPLSEDPFVGMWRDREDLADSGTWVRSLRVREWTRGRG